MARIPVATDPRSIRGGKAARVLGLIFLASLLYFVPVAVLHSTGSEAAQRDILDDGELPAEPMGVLEALLIFAGIPLLIMLVVTLLVLLPDLIRGPRYRPSRGWSGGATWFAGPPDAERAVREASAGGQTRGGARGSW